MFLGLSAVALSTSLFIVFFLLNKVLVLLDDLRESLPAVRQVRPKESPKESFYVIQRIVGLDKHNNDVFIMGMGLLLFLLAHSIVLARVKYDGGDWYNDPSALSNLASEINNRTAVRVSPDQAVVGLDGPNLFNYPFIFLTGHGKIEFSNREAENLRNYLVKGGFLYADDDYGMDKHFRREIMKVFPGLEFEELPFTHPIYNSFYEFSCLPKIHKHDGKPPKGFGLFYQGRLVIFYTHETNISDGWADPWVHKDSPEKRDQAFRFGTNILLYALNEQD